MFLFILSVCPAVRLTMSTWGIYQSFVNTPPLKLVHAGPRYEWWLLAKSDDAIITATMLLVTKTNDLDYRSKLYLI